MAHATTSNLGMQDYFTTTLNGAVLVGDTVINLNAVPTASEGYLVIDPNNVSTREIIYYTSKGAGSVTCPDNTQGSGRGVGGTTAQGHNSGVTVELREVAEYWNALQNGESMATGSVNATLIAVNGVQAQNLSPKAITLGYVTMSINATSPGNGTWTAVPSLSLPVTIPSGNRTIRVTFNGPVNATAANNNAVVGVWDGTVGSGTQVSQGQAVSPGIGYNYTVNAVAILPSLAAGSKTYNVGFQGTGAPSSTVISGTTFPAFLLVEAI